MLNWIEMVKEDVNQEDGVIISYFSKVTTYLFIGVIMFSIPIFIYLLISMF